MTTGLNKCDICDKKIPVGKRFIEVDATAYIVGVEDDGQIAGMVGLLICEDHRHNSAYAYLFKGVEEVNNITIWEG